MSRAAAPAAVTIVPATASRALRQFIELPFVLHRGDPHWVPPLRRDERRRFDPSHNAFLAHATMTPWLAERDGRVVGRIAAIHDRLHDEKFGERTAWFGFFEAEDAAAARALLAHVERWAGDAGFERVRGPVNASMNESPGLLVSGFDSMPYLLMPHNPPHYERFITAAGYAKVKDLLAWDIDATAPLPERMARMADRARDRFGITIRTVDMRRFDEELQLLKRIYQTAWQDNWGFVPPTDAEIEQMAHELRPVVDPRLVLFAEMRGEPVGCTVALPDLNQVLAKMGGRLTPISLLHFLRRRRTVSRVRLLLLGIVPSARRLGLYPLLVAEIYRRTQQAGYVRAEVGWTLEDNDLINTGIAAAGAHPYKRYRLYEKPLR